MPRVTVQFSAQAAVAAGAATEEVEITGAPTVANLLALLSERHGGRLRNLFLDSAGRPQPSLLLFVNDAQVRPQDPGALRDGDEVSIMLPIAGG